MFKKIEAFIRETYNCPKAFLPLHEPKFLGNELKYVTEAIESTFVSSVGKFVNQFEESLAEYTGAKRAVAISNGTSALHLAMKIVGVDQSSEVFMQPLSFVATANAAAYLLAKPHFIDVDLDTMSMSPEALKKRIEKSCHFTNNRLINRQSGRQIKACVPMHTFGHAARIDEICEICDYYNIAVIEDAAESLGTTFKNQHTGTFGTLGIYSFNGNKTITSGGGGAIVTNNEKLGTLAKHLSTTAKVPHAWEYKHDNLGYNYRMPNLNAALLCAQMEMLPSFLENKNNTALKYKDFFEDFEDIIYKVAPAHCNSNYWLNAIQLKDNSTKDLFLKEMNENGVMTRPIWQLLNTLPMYDQCPSGDLDTSIFLADRIVNIPSSVIL